MNAKDESRDVALRSDAELHLDLEIALRIEEYTWVEWHPAGLGHTPLYEGGRFVGHPGDVLAHHYVPADPGAPLAPQPYRRLPGYSADTGLALRAAERAGIFAGHGARLSASDTGIWTLVTPDPRVRVEDDSLPRLLCRASLLWIDRPDSPQADEGR